MKTKKIYLKNIINLINCDYTMHGFGKKKYVTKVKSLTEADEETLVFINKHRTDKEKLLNETKANVIICDDSISLKEIDIRNKIIIFVKNPKLVFIQIVKKFFVEKTVYGIHPSSVIHKDAIISDNVYIGPHTYIGRSVIKEGTIIHGNVHIKDNVEIGKNVIIQAGCIIGGTGINFEIDDDNNYHDFPHLGGVIIEDNVEIQAQNVIDRGVLNNTIIGKKTKIDSHCYIAHNCKIGEENIIIGNTMISGSVTTGNRCWFGPASIIRDGIIIGNHCYIGMGSIVVSDLIEYSKVMGNPARPIDDMKKILKKFKTFINEKR